MNARERMQKMAREAVAKASEAVTQANIALSEAQAVLHMMEELAPEDLDGVAGGSNPFETDPRVPDNAIDGELRENG